MQHFHPITVASTWAKSRELLSFLRHIRYHDGKDNTVDVMSVDQRSENPDLSHYISDGSDMPGVPSMAGDWTDAVAKNPCWPRFSQGVC